MTWPARPRISIPFAFVLLMATTLLPAPSHAQDATGPRVFISVDMEGIGAATKSLHPKVSREEIRSGVAEAVRNRADYRPYRLDAPYRLVLRLKTEESVYNGSFFPGAERTGDWELTITSDDFLDLMYAYSIMRR